MNKVVTTLNNRYLIAAVTGLFVLGLITKFAKR